MFLLKFLVSKVFGFSIVDLCVYGNMYGFYGFGCNVVGGVFGFCLKLCDYYEFYDIDENVNWSKCGYIDMIVIFYKGILEGEWLGSEEMIFGE